MMRNTASILSAFYVCMACVGEPTAPPRPDELSSDLSVIVDQLRPSLAGASFDRLQRLLADTATMAKLNRLLKEHEAKPRFEPQSTQIFAQSVFDLFEH